MEATDELPAGGRTVPGGSVGGRPPERWRRLPVGAEVMPGGAGVHFRLWAPDHRSVRVVLEGGPNGDAVDFEMVPEPGGYFSAAVGVAGAGTLYRFVCDDDGDGYPDPASRFQPDGPHGPSQVIDPEAFPWTDSAWPGASLADQVLYELHVGTFTVGGTWRSAGERLADLAETGITVIELMPVADFNGRFGWGYDGVNLFAPTRLHGPPDDFRLFVDHAHALGLAVILDVVYNHFGPDGNFLGRFASAYQTDRHDTEWGPAVNFDGPDSGPVREFVLANAGYWIDEFHLDGLRLDATQTIHDTSPDPIVAAIIRRVREGAAGRATMVVVENEPQDSRLIRPADEGGFGADGLWNDDFHHSAMVALTGRSEAYFSDYRGRAQEFVSAARHGTLFQGQWYAWQGKRRGTPTTGLPPTAFVTYLQNHDQVANTGHGRRGHALSVPGAWRAMTALLLLGPWTPMLFQGQEFAASASFRYFADHAGGLGRAVRAGRVGFLAQFPSLADPAMRDRLPDPGDPATFAGCVIDHDERHQDHHAEILALHRDLIRLRREEAALVAARAGRPRVEGAVLDDHAFVLRFADDSAGPGIGDRLLVVNLGGDLLLRCLPDPLLAPPAGCRWGLRWSSEDPCYGGGGTPAVENEGTWRVIGYAAVLLAPEPEVSAGEGPEGWPG